MHTEVYIIIENIFKFLVTFMGITSRSSTKLSVLLLHIPLKKANKRAHPFIIRKQRCHKCLVSILTNSKAQKQYMYQVFYSLNSLLSCSHLYRCDEWSLVSSNVFSTFYISHIYMDTKQKTIEVNFWYQYIVRITQILFLMG